MKDDFDEDLTVENAFARGEQVIRSLAPLPHSYHGRGIVMCGGGLKYFTCAWVNINMLRRLGCPLPIQLWYLGEREMDKRMIALLTPLGVECVNAEEVRKKYPVRILLGWESKPYAILHSPFEEVLLMDADNMAVVSPEFLFETPQYRETGALFWPDFRSLEPTNKIWELCGVAYRNEPEFESGQLVVDKKRCWDALSLCMWYNEHSDFFYNFVHGDKETFHLAFRRMDRPYKMPSRGVEKQSDIGVIHQYDFDGNLLFVHQRKWDYHLTNSSIGFPYSQECQVYIEELRQRWDGCISP